ncbi:N-acetylglucosamine kinase [Kribbella catacumbae]|uniref:N-acetylglucosamine kinase n=1 Tax=Kribbella catacumbae TaxID=460086 RepID=UPI0003806A2D|nr:BadF/BadG/BcrA/BcrD ATPase family protein [Kribbella catacumbae]
MSHLAFDGGQSALRLRVLPSGTTAEGPGYAHGSNSVQATLEAIRLASEKAGVSEPVEVVALGLTGFPQDPATARKLAEGIGELLQATEVRLTQDMVTAHAGALPDGYGVVVAAGTGLVCLAVDRDGSWYKVDGHGYMFGDAGSAFAIGRAGLVAVQRARDGRGPATTLAETELDPIALYPSPTLVDDVARFAPEVLRRAAEDDLVAQDIVLRAAADIAETIATAVGRLAGNEPVPVACVGGLFAGAGEQLAAPMRAALPARAHLTEAAGNSLDGAERLATAPPGPYAELLVIHRSR